MTAPTPTSPPWTRSTSRDTLGAAGNQCQKWDPETGERCARRAVGIVAARRAPAPAYLAVCRRHLAHEAPTRLPLESH